ncbi:hypothetical protein [Enterobacter sp.]|uniref:hypothetical protein n=1 Tax=Enterobacter sp. TaxID=42895 RepID=UPI00296F2DD7|nr:hypothetical protein [Enterobacter sp.]
MMMKKVIMAVMLSGLMISNAFAISESYRAKLKKSGCTQVTEANGTCDINKSKAANSQHKDTVYKLDDVSVVIKSDQSVTVNGKYAAVSEKNANATVYEQGIYTVIVYAKKVSLMKNGVYVADMKKDK